MQEAPEAPPGTAAEKPFVHRRPIHESAGQVAAYELALAWNRMPLSMAGDLLRSDLGTFSDVGLDQIVGDRLAFIDVPPEAVLRRECAVLAKNRVVLHILEDVSGPEMRRAVEDLRSRGYALALAAPADSAPKQDTPAADIVRIDTAGMDAETLSRRVEALRLAGVKLF